MNPNNAHNPQDIELAQILRNQDNEPMYQAINIGIGVFSVLPHKIEFYIFAGGTS